MRRSIIHSLIVLCLTAAACITGRDEPDSGGPPADGAPVLKDGPPKQDTGNKDVGNKDGDKKDIGKKDGGGTVPGKWVKVTVKSFTMGAADNEPCSKPAEESKHQVTLTRNFEMQTTEVTQDQFQQLMGFNKSYFKSCGGTCPIDSVSWHQAAAYCNELSKKRGVKPCYSCTKSGTTGYDCAVESSHKTIYDCAGYRLPTEAEWEFAYRAGSQTPLYNGPIDSQRCNECSGKGTNANKIGWYCANAGGKPHPVGGKAANALGLYDMAGNLYEWTADAYKQALGTAPAKNPWHDDNDTTKTTKGGCWEHRSYRMRAAHRNDGKAAYGTVLIGFRCVRSL